MPKKIYGKKKSKRSYKRRYKRVRKISRGLSNNCHHFKERFVLGLYQPPTTNADLHNGLSFRINQCSNISNLASVYDQYRINKVVVTFRPVSTDNTYQSGFVYPGKLLVVKDVDDQSSLSTQNDYYQHPDCKMMPLVSTKKLTVSFVPAVLDEVYRSAINTTYVPKFKQWCDMAHPDTPHFGLKFGMIRNGADGFQINWPSLPPAVEAFVTMYYSCKNVR